MAQSRRTIALDPRDLALSYHWLAQCLEHQGRQRESIEAWERSRALRGNPQVAEEMQRTFDERGWQAYWRQRLRKSTPESERAAVVHVRLGSYEEALRSLEILLDERHARLAHLNQPHYDPLRSVLSGPSPAGRLQRRIHARLKASRPPLPPAGATSRVR